MARKGYVNKVKGSRSLLKPTKGFYQSQLYPLYPTTEAMKNIDNTLGDRLKVGTGRISKCGLRSKADKYRTLNRMYLRSLFIRVHKPEKTYGAEFKTGLHGFIADINKKWAKLHSDSHTVLEKHDIDSTGLDPDGVIKLCWEDVAATLTRMSA